jgi:hypothetical protein
LTWSEVLKTARIHSILRPDDPNSPFRYDTFLVLDDGTFYKLRFPARAFEEFESDWNNFIAVESNAREAIVDALLEDRDARRGPPMILYITQNIDTYLSEKASNASERMGTDEADALVTTPPNTSPNSDTLPAGVS